MATHDIVMSAAGGTAGAVNWIDDVFSTYLYTGNGSTQTITNGIDLATKGGLVWNKKRSATDDHYLWDTARPIGSYLSSNLTDAQGSTSTGRIAYSSTGFQWLAGGGGYNQSGQTYASWTFAKQAKFFDVVTWTGNGVDGRTIAHNLGSVPGCIIVKQTSGTSTWRVYHRSTGNDKVLFLNDTAAASTGNSWAYTNPTSTVFSVSDSLAVNASGETYVAYLFAHDAGGFGTAGTDNVISCGSFTTDGSGNADINLGYEPQWILLKRNFSGANWLIFDNMRGMPVTGNAPALFPNLSDADTTQSSVPRPNATGFSTSAWSASATYIYIAIRRPMKPPTSGTEVFKPVTRTGTGSSASITGAGFAPDFDLVRARLATTSSPSISDRLRGSNRNLFTAFTDAETTSSSGADITAFTMDGVSLGVSGSTDINTNGANEVHYLMRRASTFFDVVCYTGTGTANTAITHNLTVAPELVIVKRRDSAGSYWRVLATPFSSLYGNLNVDNAFISGSGALWGNGTTYTAPTSTTFTVSASNDVNASGGTFVAYLFATVAGVSKVGSYTGTGSTQQINCGFSGGARFVLIKRTDSTGDWYVWDSARGIVSGNDPYLLLNSTAAEVTSTDYIDPYSAGFELSSTAPAAINANGGSYIYLAIA